MKKLIILFISTLLLVAGSNFLNVVSIPIAHAASEPTELCLGPFNTQVYALEVIPRSIPSDGTYRVQFMHLWAKPGGEVEETYTWNIIVKPKNGVEKKTGKTLTVKYLGEKEIYLLDVVSIAGGTARMRAADHGSGAFTIKMSDPKNNYTCGGESNEFIVGTGLFEEPDVGGKTETPFGTIEASPKEIATMALNIAVGVAGGIAFLLMVFGSYRLIFAGGNPESIQQGREIITAAIAGLLVIIFSVFFLRLVGMSILGLNL